LENIVSWVIVNEYAADGKTNWRSILTKRYPFITFIQKNKHQKGQAASMNIILKIIPTYTYWIHWEEAWYTETPFLNDAVSIMNSTEITQIQFTRQNNVVNWMKQGSGNDSLGTDDHMLACDDENRYCIVEASAKVWNNVDVYDGCCNNWPLYSLLPSINRVSVYTFGEFSTDPALWPFVFEYYFAKKWLKNGGVKAVLAYGPVVRDDKNHVSTYNYGGASAGRTRRLSKSEILAIVLSAIIVGIGICVGIYFGVVNGDKLKSI